MRERSLATYIAHRLALMVPLLIGVSFVTFAIINLIPGSPVTALRDDSKIRPETREALSRQLGLDKPWPVRYVEWLGNLLRGDLGTSMYNQAPVAARIGNVLPNTLLLTGSAFGLALLVAVPLGIAAAVRHRTWIDHFVVTSAVATHAMPAFLLALLLVIVFALKFNEWGLPSLPVGGMSDPRGDGGPGERVRYLILPVVSLALIQVGAWAAYVRSAMLETLAQDFVRTARAKGLAGRSVVYRHAFRNALLPLVTLVTLSLPALFGGALVIETIFAWNGIGRLTIEAVDRRDYTLIMGTTVLFAALTMLANLLADVVYAVLDPRVQIE